MAVISDHCPEIKITLVDIDVKKISDWNHEDLNQLPIFEPGLKEVVGRNRNKNLFFSIDIEKSKEKDESLSHFIEGIELTEKQVIEIFKKFNIEKINSLNAVFDPNLHQAMFEVEKEDMEPGYVAEVVQEGYMIGERLLRPAMVGVSKKKTQ